MSDQPKSAAEDPAEYKAGRPGDDDGSGKKEVSPKNQLVGLLLLLVVFGILWGIAKGMPILNTWMDEKRVAIMEGESGAGEKENAETPAPAPAVAQNDNSAPFPAAPQMVTPSTDRFRSQIMEQMGGAEKVEVRHLAISDDEKRMVAALRLAGEGGEAELIEVFFERDEFGRYLSTEDSPVDVPLKLWSE